MLLVYTHKITSRIKYIFGLIFGDLLGIPYQLSQKPEDFAAYEGPKLSYTRQPLGDEIFFSSSNLLFERGIGGQELTFMDFDGTKGFYLSSHKLSAMPFDPFAASFYLVSRYEEYMPYVKDPFDRFNANLSVACQKGFLQKPVVNIWSIHIGRMLHERFPSLSIPGKKYRFIHTIDIDAAWTYREKGFARSVGGYLKSLAAMNLHEMRNRTRVLAGLSRDPYDTYDDQHEIHQKYNIRPIYFILFADYALNDKNIHVNNRHFQVLIKSLADYADIGLHSSFGSSFQYEKLKQEVERLSTVLNKEINRGRQHFLRLDIPYIYRNFIDLDILEDYSMGYNTPIGFRAGITDPFRFYDLDTDAVTKLVVYPFAFAETKFNTGPYEERLQKIREVIQEVKNVNGTLVGLWDNESMSNLKIPSGWRAYYDRVLELAVDR
jgi:hypothetical protein